MVGNAGQVDPAVSVKQSPPQAAKAAVLGGTGWSRQIGLLVAPVLVVFLAILLRRVSHSPPPEVQPLAAERLSLLPAFQGSYRSRGLWGTYRPGLYFGMRMRLPRSLLTGLMWFDPDRPDAPAHIRHLAQERDGLARFGWERHDWESFGRQELLETSFRVTTSMVKRFCEGCYGGDWATRVSVQPSGNRDAASEGQEGEEEHKQRISLLLYIADEQGGSGGSQSGTIELLPKAGPEGRAVILAQGEATPVGGWALHASGPGRRLPRVQYLGAVTSHFHNLTELAAQAIAAPLLVAPGRRSRRDSRLFLPNMTQPGANVALFQVTATLPLTLDFVFTGSLRRTAPQESVWQRLTRITAHFYQMLAGSTVPGVPWPTSMPPNEQLDHRIQALSGDKLTELLYAKEAAFDANFKAKFGSLDGPHVPEGTAEAAKAALSNMLGGIGYFYGSSDVSVAHRVLQTPAAALLTAVPSRSFFPRGFLWDEGFHQLLIRKWNRRLSRDILAHWMDLLNSQGWMAREQILGEEARARVPAEFIVQDPTAANPPTLFLPLADMARRVSRGPTGIAEEDADLQEEADFLKAAFPRMRAWLDWFLSTQQGQLPGSWRWRGRDADTNKELNPKTLTSGLDDYPRASHPSEDERHVDLYCWIALAARSLATIGETLNAGHDIVTSYRLLADRLGDLGHLNALHYDATGQQYRDWGNHTEDVALRWKYLQLPDGRQLRTEYVRVITGADPQPGYVPQYGYVSLFPLLMRMLPPNSSELHAQLEHLKDESQAWTRHGLRSLSKAASIHGKRNTEHDAPYWRGPIWININYLALAALKQYAQAGGLNADIAAGIHTSLRQNLLRTLVGQYQQSGYLWENYNEETGGGRGCRPFTGWSALVVLIAGEAYFDV